MSSSAPLTRTRNAKDSELPHLPHGMIRTSTNDQLGGVNLRQVTVLSKTDWEGIQYRLNKRQIEAERIRQIQEEKRRLHELSLERVKNWSNTVYGQRQKKLEDRRIRLENEEEERKKIDVQEAMFQAEKRKAVIEKAKLQQYYKTDRVKAFHSALQLTEVLKEREAQIELKKLKDEGLRTKDKDYLEKMRHDLEVAKQIEEDEKMKVREAKIRTVEFQLAQKRERERQAEREKEEALLEAEELKRLAAEHAEEERKKELWRVERAKKQAADNKQQIEDDALIKHIDKMQEEDEDEECRLFAAAKRKMMKMRAEKEKQLRDEKQAQLEFIGSKLRTQMGQKVSNEDERIKAAMMEKEAQKAAEEAEKAEKREKIMKSIEKHRVQQTKRNEEMSAAEKRAAVAALKTLREAATVFAANEEEKLRVRKEVAKEFAEIQLEQAEERRLCEQERREQDEEQLRRNLELNEIGEAQFQAYARDVIEHSEKRGRNTFPLRRVVAQVQPGRTAQRPNYVVSDQTGAELPNFQTCATDATKRNINGKNDTDKRLGFVW